MKAPSHRFMVRTALLVCAAGAFGAFGACQKGGITPPPPIEPPPPPPAVAAPTNLAATPISTTQINLAWTDASSNEDGFKIERCSGAGCSSFAEIGATAANTASFSNTGLTAGTAYNFRVRAFNASTASDFSNASQATTLSVAVPGAVMIGAGEITSCRSGQSISTSKLIEAEIAKSPEAIVFSAGSNVSDTTAGCFYDAAFEASGWAQFKPRMRVALSQRDYEVGKADSTRPVRGSTAVYNYWGDRAGERAKGWYSFDVGTTWHVVVLNTATWDQGNGGLTDPSSPQNTWLANDLATNTRPCVMAILNHARFYSGGTNKSFGAFQLWTTLYNNRADLVVSAWFKWYERYAPSDRDGNPDPVNGVRQITVGTGGRSLDGLADTLSRMSTLEVRNASTQGVLKLTLDQASYSWEFLPTTPGGFTDSGTTNCH